MAQKGLVLEKKKRLYRARGAERVETGLEVVRSKDPSFLLLLERGSNGH